MALELRTCIEVIIVEHMQNPSQRIGTPDTSQIRMPVHRAAMRVTHTAAARAAAKM